MGNGSAERVHGVRTRLRKRALAVVLAVGVGYLVVVANLTVFPEGGSGPRNFVPFRTIWGYLDGSGYPGSVRFRNLVGNLALLAPLGVLLALTTRLRLGRMALALGALSVGIEAWQLLASTGRSVDIDDVILNTAGGVVGSLVGLALLRLLDGTRFADPVTASERSVAAP